MASYEGFSSLVPGIAKLAAYILTPIIALIVFAVCGWWWTFALLLIVCLAAGAYKFVQYERGTTWEDDDE